MIPCAVLEDGRRVLTQQGFVQAIGRTRPPGGKGQSAAIERLLAFLASDSLKAFISEDLKRSSIPIVFQAPKGGGYQGNRAFGHSAELLPGVCNVYLEARRQGTLPSNQSHIAAKCELLLRGLAHVQLGTSGSLNSSIAAVRSKVFNNFWIRVQWSDATSAKGDSTRDSVICSS